MATREYPSPSRSASGQLNANAGNRGRLPPPGTNEAPSLFATRPLPESPAAAYARSTEQLPTYSPRPMDGLPRASQEMPVYNPRLTGEAPATQTVGYGQAQPSYAASPPVPGAAAAKAPRPSKPRQTAQVPVQTANWQSSLPVSPWSAYERQAGPVTGLETETVLRTDLRSLKRGRTRARIYLLAVVILAAVAGHFLLKVLERNAARVQTLEQENRSLRAQLGGAEAAPAARAGEESVPAAAAPAGGSSAGTRALADELKRALVGDTALTVEARGDKVVVSMADTTLFEGSRPEVNQAGYRVLYRFGKAIKNVQDRHIVVALIMNAGVQKRPWVTAAMRGVSLGRFLIDDLTIDGSRVSVMAPTPRTGAGKTDKVEFRLEPQSADSGHS